MTAIDNRIVSIEFDNKAFQTNITETLVSLEALRKSLNFENAGASLAGISSAASNVDLSGISSSVDGISSRFSAMGAVAFTVIQSITTSALDMAKKLSGIIFDPIAAGGKQRALNIEQAKFQFRGLGADVELGMKSAKDAVLGTAFGLDEAAKAAAQLNASGKKLGPEMTSTLRGIAGAAAMTGTSFTEIADIYTSSAAIGKITNQDLQQFATRGLNVSAAISKQLGITEKQVKELASSGKLDFDTFAKAMDGAFGEHATKANETYAGSLANMKAALSRLGASFQGPLLEQKRDIFNALTPVIDKVTAALKPLINAFTFFTRIKTDRLTKGLKGLNVDKLAFAIPNVVKGLVNVFKSLFKVLDVVTIAFRSVFPKSTATSLFSLTQGFAKFTEKLRIGARGIAIVFRTMRGFFGAIKIGFSIIKGIYGTLKAFFGSIQGVGDGLGAFFAKVGRGISVFRYFLEVSKTIPKFFDKMSKAAVNGAKGFHGVFAIFGAIFSTIKVGVRFINALQQPLRALFQNLVEFGKGRGGGVIKFFEKIAHTVDNFNQMLLKGGIAAFMSNLTGWINQPGKALDDLKKKISGMFTAFTSGDTKDGEKKLGIIGQLIEKVRIRFTQFVTVGKSIARVFKKIGSALAPLISALSSVVDYLKTWFADLGAQLAGAVKENGFSAALDALNVGLFGGIILLVKKFMDGSIFNNIGGNLFESIQGSFDQLTGTLKTMQAKLKVEILLKIAYAVGILALSMVALSLIDSAALTKALAAMAIGFGQLVATMALLDKVVADQKSAAKLALVAGALIGAAIALAILSVAVKILASMNMSELAKGLGGVTLLLGAMVIAFNSISGDTKGMFKAALAIGAISIALLILSVSVKLLSTIKFTDLMKGLGGVALLLGALVLTFNSISGDTLGMFKAALAMGAIAAALLVLSISVKLLSTMSWEELAKGLGGVALLLAAMVIAINNLSVNPAGVLAASVSMIAISVALVIMSRAVKTLAKLKLGKLIQGVVAIAAMLVILVVAANAMTGALSGALAIIVMAEALRIFAEVISIIGKMSIAQIITGILGMAIALGVLGLLSLLMAPLVPIILALGAALLVVGAGFALFGFGASMVAKAFKDFASAGKKGVQVLLDIFELLIAALPRFLGALAEGIVEMVKVFLDAAPLLIDGLNIIIGKLLDSVIELAPKFFEAIGVIIDGMIVLMNEKGPAFINAGINLLLALLAGIDSNIEEIATRSASIITKFLAGIAAKAEEITQAATNLLIAFLFAMAGDVTSIASAASTLITSIITEVGKLAEDFVTAGGAALVSFLKGLGDVGTKVIEAVATLISAIFAELGKGAATIAFAGAYALGEFLDSLTDNVTLVGTKVGELVAEIIHQIGLLAEDFVTAGADALVSFLKGVGDNLVKVCEAAGGVVQKFIDCITEDSFGLFLAGAGILATFIGGILSGIGHLAVTAGIAVYGFVTGVHTAINDFVDNLIIEGVRIGAHIISGIVKGIEKHAPDAYSAIGKLVSGVIGAATGGWLINSPSKVFVKIAGSIVEGLVAGLDDHGDALASVTNMADRVTQTFGKSLGAIPSMIEGMDEFNPVIAPVLDLTQVKSDAKRIAGLVGISPIVPQVSYDQATLISHNTDVPNEVNVTSEPSSIVNNFEQNNYSPKALSTADIYRSTKSQIALAKQELKIA